MTKVRKNHPLSSVRCRLPSLSLVLLHSPLRHALRCDTLTGEPFKLVAAREALPMRRRGLGRKTEVPCILGGLVYKMIQN